MLPARRRDHPGLLLLLCVVALACDDDEEAPDASEVLEDGGSFNDAATDAGSLDGANTDAGSLDGGATDAGSPDGADTDAGSLDDGATDAGDPSPACDRWSTLSEDQLQWETLPPLGSGNADNAGQASVTVDAAGVIYVVGSYATAPDWSTPWRLEVHRYVDDAWEMVGGEPAYSGGSGWPGAIAVDDAGEVYALVPGEQTAEVVVASGTSAWQRVELPATELDSPTPRALASDRTGGMLVVLEDDVHAEVHRRRDGAWQRLGTALDFTIGAVQLAADCQGRVAALLGEHVHWFDGDAWQALGPFDSEGNAEFPALSVGSDAQPLVTWRTGGDTLQAARYDRAAEEFVKIDSPFSFEGNASYVVPAVDDANRPFLVWRESVVFVAHLEDDQWAPFIDDGDVSGGLGTLPDIALSPEGLPVVVFEGVDHDDSSDLRIGIARAVPKP